MTEWNLLISDETDRSVKEFLSRQGADQDLSKFVDRVVRQAIFWETVESIQNRNKDLTPEQADELANKAVADVRENRS